AVGQVGDDVLHGERLVAPQPAVGQADPVLLQQHRVVGLGGYGDGVHAALAHQGVEDAAVFVLVGAVPGDLGGKNALVLGDQGGDAGVLPAALRLAARGDRAEQGERFVVVEDLLEQTPGRKHRDHLFRGLAG